MQVNEFSHLGNIFNQRRLEKNLSLKEVENAISIRSHYLAAIEEGHLGKLISPIYAQGFIRKYAAFLELDSEALLQQHPHVLKILNSRYEEKEEFVFGVGTLEMRGHTDTEIRGFPNLLWIGLSLVFLVSCWFLARYIGLF